MASDDIDAGPVLPETDRRELERIAFARPRTEQDAAAAREALRRLVAADEAAAAARAPGPVRDDPAPEPAADPVPFPDDVDVDVDVDDAAAQPVRRRRSLIPLLVVIGLVLGIGAGVLIAHASPSLISAAPKPTAAATPSSRPPLGAATNAFAELARPQTPQDVFPITIFADSLDLEKTSIHRVLTTNDGITLWIGRSPQDICMMYTSTKTSSTTDAESGASCASIFEFGDSGLSLHVGVDTWGWDGTSFTTTIAG